MQLLAALVVSTLATSSAQEGMDGMPPKKPKPAPLKADLKYIKCAVCEKAVAEAMRQLEELSSMNAVEDMLESLCNADADGTQALEGTQQDLGRGKQGGWMHNLDISKKGRALVVEDKGSGYCRRECRTVAKACGSVIEPLVEEDLAAVLWNSRKASVGTVVQRVCTEMASVCKRGKVPLWPEGKARKNEEFKPKDAKSGEIDDLLANMRGAPGSEGLVSMSASDFDFGDDKVDDIDVLRDEL